MTRRIVSSRGRLQEMPAKPRKDFPLFPHRSGQWAKKVRGKLHYFGTLDDPLAAERKWEQEKFALLEGRPVTTAISGDSVGWIVNVFLDAKLAQLERGEFSQRSYNDYREACERVTAYFGIGRALNTLRPPDFDAYRNSLPESWGPVTVNNHLRQVRALFRYANAIEATEGRIRYELGLKDVPKPVMRKHQAKQPAKEFTAAEIHALLDHAKSPMRAFILLGINAAYGPMDIARMKASDVDFDRSWIGEPRGKTGVSRGAWLWPETIAAVREAIDKRPPAAREHEHLAFLTRSRLPWAEDGVNRAPLSAAFAKLKKAAGIDRVNVGHYSLRHTFETIAGDSKDQPAVDYIMGHIDNSMAGVYREGIDPSRIEAVCKHVRNWWLAGAPKKDKAKDGHGLKLIA